MNRAHVEFAEDQIVFDRETGYNTKDSCFDQLTNDVNLTALSLSVEIQYGIDEIDADEIAYQAALNLGYV